ncbi:MAG TPA: hypothetical protein P5123_10940 [Spirochaetota bacterium]|nr:hypothetical protein [Spirochaetota bacterium]
MSEESQISNELQEITNRIKSNVSRFEKLRREAGKLKQQIADDVLFVAKNKNRLLPNRTLQDYIENDLKISKQYFYSIKRSYDFLIENNKAELIRDTDFRIVDDISRVKDKEKQKELLAKTTFLTRDQIREEIQKYARHTSFDKKYNSKGSSAPEKTIASLFEDLYTLIDYHPEQISKSKKEALSSLIGGEKTGGIIQRMMFTEKQLTAIRDHLDKLIKRKKGY